MLWKFVTLSFAFSSSDLVDSSSDVNDATFSSNSFSTLVSIVSSPSLRLAADSSFSAVVSLSVISCILSFDCDTSLLALAAFLVAASF